jgi:hypothetical protein
VLRIGEVAFLFDFKSLLMQYIIGNVAWRDLAVLHVLLGHCHALCYIQRVSYHSSNSEISRLSDLIQRLGSVNYETMIQSIMFTLCY